jgi:hypothetical protein
MGSASGPLILLDPALGSKDNGSCDRNRFSRVRRQDPGFLGLKFLNIIICIINIIIFIIIKSINIKNIIICVINIIIFILIKSINIKNNIMCDINIIIF